MCTRCSARATFDIALYHYRNRRAVRFANYRMDKDSGIKDGSGEKIVFSRSDLQAIDEWYVHKRVTAHCHRVPSPGSPFDSVRAIPISFLAQTGISTTIFRDALICLKTWMDVPWRKFTSMGTDHVLVTTNDPNTSVRNGAQFYRMKIKFSNVIIPIFLF